MGITRQDFALFSTVAMLTSANLRPNTRAELLDGTRYIIESSNNGGIELDNGLYANPIELTTASLISSSLDIPTGSVVET